MRQRDYYRQNEFPQETDFYEKGVMHQDKSYKPYKWTEYEPDPNISEKINYFDRDMLEIPNYFSWLHKSNLKKRFLRFRTWYFPLIARIYFSSHWIVSVYIFWALSQAPFIGTELSTITRYIFDKKIHVATICFFLLLASFCTIGGETVTHEISEQIYRFLWTGAAARWGAIVATAHIVVLLKRIATGIQTRNETMVKSFLIWAFAAFLRVYQHKMPYWLKDHVTDRNYSASPGFLLMKLWGGYKKISPALLVGIFLMYGYAEFFAPPPTSQDFWTPTWEDIKRKGRGGVDDGGDDGGDEYSKGSTNLETLERRGGRPGPTMIGSGNGGRNVSPGVAMLAPYEPENLQPNINDTQRTQRRPPGSLIRRPNASGNQNSPMEQDEGSSRQVIEDNNNTPPSRGERIYPIFDGEELHGELPGSSEVGKILRRTRSPGPSPDTPESVRGRPRNPREMPRSRHPSDRPRSRHPSSNVGSHHPSERPRSQNPSERPRSQNPSERPGSQNPSERPRSQNPSERPGSQNPSEGPRNQSPSPRGLNNSPSPRGLNDMRSSPSAPLGPVIFEIRPPPSVQRDMEPTQETQPEVDVRSRRGRVGRAGRDRGAEGGVRERSGAAPAAGRGRGRRRGGGGVERANNREDDPITPIPRRDRQALITPTHNMKLRERVPYVNTPPSGFSYKGQYYQGDETPYNIHADPQFSRGKRKKTLMS
ncbi:hypothetical protein RUND412_000303 [Rhizina undulata]